mmetsp:Transcript_5510/g.19179  ORF Transcript_5510/g.19179 Transcript_5510/m.19179 type:complete len:288 (+) Transcript_5510:756-1619(+)
MTMAAHLEAKAEAEATAAAEILISASRSQNEYNILPDDGSEQHSVAQAAMTSAVGGAYLSVQDLIQASIQANGNLASLREIYAFCENKTLLYKRSSRSRLLSENRHYKSQIRHALYKAGRFVRNAENPDLWEVEKKWRDARVVQQPALGGALHSNNGTEVAVAADYGTSNPTTTATSLNVGEVQVKRKKRSERAERRGNRQQLESAAPAAPAAAPAPPAKKQKGLAEVSEGNANALAAQNEMQSSKQSSTTGVTAAAAGNLMVDTNSEYFSAAISAANISRVATPTP